MQSCFCLASKLWVPFLNTIRLNSPRRIMAPSVGRDNGTVFVCNVNESRLVEMHTEVSTDKT